jgi:ABC-2 type transport system permease protein
VFAVLIASGVGISFKALFYLPLVMIIEYILALGFALIVSAGTVYFKDLEHIVTVILMAWIYLTPIMYPFDMIPDRLCIIFKLNPMTRIVESYHKILYWKTVPSSRDILYSFVFALLILTIGEMIFVKLNNNFAEEL